MDRRWLAIVLLLAGTPAILHAGKATLKNGMIYEGDLVPIQGFTARQLRQQAGEIATRPYVMVDAGYKRYFLPRQQVVQADPGKRLVPFDVFELPQQASSKNLKVASIGLPTHVTPFSERGRRTVTLSTAQGSLPIVQGVTRISPHYVTIEGITGAWWQGIATSAIPADELAAMLHTATDAADPGDRMSIARFYLQAGQYEPAAEELKGIRADFPELVPKVDELDRELRQLRAQWLLAELRRRQAAGQHRFVMAAAEAFPTDLEFDAEILRQIEDLRAEYRSAREKADRALLLLGELEAQLDDPEQRAAIAALRPQIREQIDWESLGRLDAFLTLAEDEALSPAERIALAYSGWIVGSQNAVTDLAKTLALWRARHLIGEFLRSADPGRRSSVLAEMTGLEGIGPEGVAQLIASLPPWLETPDLSPGKISVLETAELVPSWGAAPETGKAVLADRAGPVRYAVILPPEYTPSRSYPLIVALRASEWRIEQAAAFWGLGLDGAGRPAAGPATSSGYIVIAPEYAAENQSSYGYTVREHLAVLAAIRDAKLRMNVDSDRVFLAGHGMGGDATFDIAMSHPDLFAGAIPISGLCDQHVRYYRENVDALPLPFYIVNGERDRNSREQNAGDLSWLMKRGRDIIWCEFVGRGYEYYQEELPNIFDWASRLTRAPDPREIDVQVLRACDDQFYWLKAEGIPQTILLGDPANPRGRTAPRPMSLEGRIGGENTITVGGAATRFVLRLNGDLIDLDERVKVHSGGRQVFNDFVAPEVGVLLDQLRETGDRQRLYTVRLVID